MTFDAFMAQHPEKAKLVNPATLRSWKQRGTVPDSAVAKMPVGVANPVATEKAPVASVATKSRVANPGLKAQGVPEAWPELTPEYCASRGYHVGKPFSWEQIVALFEDSRALLQRAA